MIVPEFPDKVKGCIAKDVCRLNGARKNKEPPYKKAGNG
jgi:hypothetical protein